MNGCLPKNAICVMRSILHIQFWSSILICIFFEFLFDNAENDSVWYHMQVKQGDTVEKCYLQAFFKMEAFSSTGAGIWMKLVEMEEIGI